jgi:hypothetical protein
MLVRQEELEGIDLAETMSIAQSKSPIQQQQEQDQPLPARVRVALKQLGPEPKGHSAKRKWRRRVSAVLAASASAPEQHGAEEDGAHGSTFAGASHGFAAVTAAPQVLVCTDLAGRGLDTVAARHVIQLDFAGDAVSHLHRAGRTGRLDRPGHVSCILGPEDVGLAAHVRAAAAKAADEDPEPSTASAADAGVAAVFSRGRSFRRKLKKQQRALDEEAAAADGERG